MPMKRRYWITEKQVFQISGVINGIQKFRNIGTYSICSVALMS
jgi:hypothetical protein